MTNSQRFGGRLLHFWPLSTMNWPEACTARIHVQGQCTCMETGIYTQNTHTHTHTGTHTYRHVHTHTHTHRQAHTQTPPHAQQRQAIRLHYIKGTAKAEKQACILSIFGFCFCMLKPLISTVENYDSLKRFSFSTWLFLFSSLSRWLAIRRNIAKDPLGRKYPPRVQTITWNPSAVFVKVISWAVRARRKYLYSLK